MKKVSGTRVPCRKGPEIDGSKVKTKHNVIIMSIVDRLFQFMLHFYILANDKEHREVTREIGKSIAIRKS